MKFNCILLMHERCDTMMKSDFPATIPLDCSTPVLFAALAKVAAGEGNRDALRAGARHEVSLHLTGDVDGRPVHRRIAAVVSVGHDQERATSATPDQPRLIAAILSKLNPATRRCILADLPREYEAAGELPAVDPELEEHVGDMLKRLRSKKQIIARGPVRCEYNMDSPGDDKPRPVAAAVAAA